MKDKEAPLLIHFPTPTVVRLGRAGMKRAESNTVLVHCTCGRKTTKGTI